MIIGFLGSGQLGFLVLKELKMHFAINFVMTDKMSLDIILFCTEQQIRFFAGNPRNGRALDQLSGIKCDLLISVNYLFLVEKDILQLPLKRAVNFHGSLLPKYRGRTPHVWAIVNNEKETGVTAHLMSDECDAGDIIAQLVIPITTTDTGQAILEKFKLVYPQFVVEVVEKIMGDDYQLSKQDHHLATFFGKRTPEDGLINWKWHKERIYNWVRALASPYPGAFSYYNGYKLIINEIEFSDLGFNFDDPNGTIVKIENGMPIIKTPNGCVKLLKFDCDNTLDVTTVLE